MELCANAPGCIFCLGAPSFFNRRVLKSPFPDIDAGGLPPVPTSGTCTTGSLTNQCEWFGEFEEPSQAQRLRHPFGVALLMVVLVAVGCAVV